MYVALVYDVIEFIIMMIAYIDDSSVLFPLLLHQLLHLGLSFRRQLSKSLAYSRRAFHKLLTTVLNTLHCKTLMEIPSNAQKQQT